MGDVERSEFETHLAEYSALRGEITQYNQRIDRTVGVYLSALVGLAGYLLRPDSTFDLLKYIESVNGSVTQATLMIVVGTLNGLLVLRLQSFFLAVLAMSQYTATVIRPRIAELVASDHVLQWDGPEIVRAKKYWLPSRTVSQSGFGLVATSLSAGAAFLGARQALESAPLAALYIVLLGVLSYVIYTFLRIAFAGSRFLEEPQALSKLQVPVSTEVRAEQPSTNKGATNPAKLPTGDDTGG